MRFRLRAPIQIRSADPQTHNRGNLVTRRILALALGASLLTAACGSTTPASAPIGSPAPAASATAAPATPTASAAQPVAGNGPALCAFLSSEIPALQAAGSTGGADSVLAIDYANWIQADSSRLLTDAAAMDTLTTASCPDIRTSVLKLIGASSFAAGF
jgi:hypothetical protein